MSFERSDCLEVNVRHCGANASTRIIGADAASSGRIVDIFMFLLCFYENIDTLRMVQIGSWRRSFCWLSRRLLLWLKKPG